MDQPIYLVPSLVVYVPKNGLHLVRKTYPFRAYQRMTLRTPYKGYCFIKWLLQNVIAEADQLILHNSIDLVAGLDKSEMHTHSPRMYPQCDYTTAPLVMRIPRDDAHFTIITNLITCLRTYLMRGQVLLRSRVPLYPQIIKPGESPCIIGQGLESPNVYDLVVQVTPW